MRLWSIHPKYLDSRGLVALWRESLLAQKVLLGQTTGYRQHPQLARFKATSDPMASIATYLWGVFTEAADRGYNFDERKISNPKGRQRINVAKGQLIYERRHLLRKLKLRDIKYYKSLMAVAEPDTHPMFKAVSGDVESWEVIS